MKCERCGKELSDADLYCDRCGQAVFPEYMDEADVWAYYKSDEELEQILKAEKEGKSEEKQTEQISAKREDADIFPESPETVSDPETDQNPETKPEILEEMSQGISAIPEAAGTAADADNTAESPAFTPERSKEQFCEELSETGENEEENFFAEDEEEDEEEESEKGTLTPEGKKARRRRIFLSALFLLLCLAAGIFLSLRKIKEMDQQEKEYYQQLKYAETSTASAAQAETTEEAKKTNQKEPEAPAVAEAQKDVKKEAYFQLVNAEEIDFSKYTKLQPVGTEENSVKQSDSYDYSAKSTIDGDTTSSWQENEEGIGEGKGVKLNLDGNHKIRYMVLYLGNWRSDELWDYNSRPKELTIQVGEAQKKDVTFSDEKEKFCLSFDEPVDAAFVSLYVKSAYQGSRWQDTCISEIELYE